MSWRLRPAMILHYVVDARTKCGHDGKKVKRPQIAGAFHFHVILKHLDHASGIREDVRQIINARNRKPLRVACPNINSAEDSQLCHPRA